MSRSGDNFQFGVSLIVIGGGLVAAAIKRFKKTRKYEDLPNIDVASAPQGLVELTGFAWAKSLQFNLEGRAITYASWKLEKYVQQGKNSYWKLIKAGALGDGFLLHDESGAAWVDALNADYDGDCKITEWKKMEASARTTFMKWIGGPVESFPPSDSFFTTSYRVCVYEIPLGCPVVAQGNFQTTHKETLAILPGLSAYRERFIKIRKNPAYALSLMDVNNDGVVNEEEFRMGNTQAAEMSARKVANGGSVPVVESIEVLGHLVGTENNKLLLANTTEKYLFDKLKKWNGTMIVCGALLIAAGVCVLANEVSGN